MDKNLESENNVPEIDANESWSFLIDLSNEIFRAAECAGKQGLETLYEQIPEILNEYLEAQGKAPEKPLPEAYARNIMLDICKKTLQELQGTDYQFVGALKEFVAEKRIDGNLLSVHESLVAGNDAGANPAVEARVEIAPAEPDTKTSRGIPNPNKPKKQLPKKKDYVDYPDPYRWQRG